MSRSSLERRRARRNEDPRVRRIRAQMRAQELLARAAEREAAGERDAAKSLRAEADRALRG